MRHAISLLLLAFGLCVSCATPRVQTSRPLIVGTTANYPPLIYQDEGRLVGAEADLVQMVAVRLNRPLQFVILSPDEGVAALLTGEIHVWASGLMLEEAQRLRLGFSEPFLQSSQMAVCRRGDRTALTSIKTLKAARMSIGVRKGGLAERLVPQMFPRAEKVIFVDEKAAVSGLVESREIELYIDDAPIIWRLVSQRDSTLAMLPFAFTTDLYVWGIHPNEPVLRSQIDDVFASWRRDGTLRAVLTKWLPIATK